jgi:hypothetical protein
VTDEDIFVPEMFIISTKVVLTCDRTVSFWRCLLVLAWSNCPYADLQGLELCLEYDGLTVRMDVGGEEVRALLNL